MVLGYKLDLILNNDLTCNLSITTNKFDIVVGENATADYTFYFKVENLKMMSGDYDVAVSSKSISHFKNTKLPIEYWIALEPDSVFNAG